MRAAFFAAGAAFFAAAFLAGALLTTTVFTGDLAAAVLRGAVFLAAGFNKPRVEGEANGEWIIVDCGAAVAHIMQPSIRDYYHLEEIWGDKPVKMKLDGEAKGLVKAEARPAAQKAGAKTAAAKTAPKRAAPKKAAPTKKRVAAKTPAKAAPRKGVSRTVGVKKAPAKKTTSAPRRGR